MSRWAIIMLLTCCFSGTSAAAFDQVSAEALFQQHCSSCHNLDRSLKKTKNRAGWQKTVTRMKGYASGLISDSDAETIVEYLSRIRGRKD